VRRELRRGGANRDIARRLHLSEKTVRNYVSGILTKLAVPDRAAAVAKARAAGLADPDRPAWDKAPGIPGHADP
jgi:DNA-binding NarL/FixJ family response regulator